MTETAMQSQDTKQQSLHEPDVLATILGTLRDVKGLLLSNKVKDQDFINDLKSRLDGQRNSLQDVVIGSMQSLGDKLITSLLELLVPQLTAAIISRLQAALASGEIKLPASQQQQISAALTQRIASPRPAIVRSKATLKAEKILRASVTKYTDDRKRESVYKDHLATCTGLLLRRYGKRVMTTLTLSTAKARRAGIEPPYSNVFEVIDDEGLGKEFLEIVEQQSYGA